MARKHGESYTRDQRSAFCRELNLWVLTLSWYRSRYASDPRDGDVPGDFLRHLC